LKKERENASETHSGKYKFRKIRISGKLAAKHAVEATILSLYDHYNCQSAIV